MSVKVNLGGVTAYAAAVAAGYTGTKEQFAAEQAEFAANAAAVAAAKAAAEAAQAAAETAKTNAETAQAAAVASASAASASASTASTKASEASSSASAAAASALAAAESEANAATVAEETAQAVVDNKLDIDGYSALVRVGLADNLAGKGDGVDAEYTYRTTGGSADVADGTATVKSIKGNTIVWNQGVVLRETRTSGGMTFTNNGNGSITITGTCTATDIYTLGNVSAVVGHKHLSRAVGTTGSLIVERNGAVSADGIIFTDAYASNSFYLNAVSGTTYNLTVWLECFDLTQMFGAGNELSSVDAFKTLFPKDYYAYDTGSLLSFVGNGIKTVGFNQWDEEWEHGGISDTGTENTVEFQIRSKNHIQIFPNTNYYFKTTYTIGRVCYYDSNKSFVTSAYPFANATFITPTNAYYMRFVLGSSVTPVTQYNGGLSINLSWSGYRNGEYEDYWTQTRNLPIATYFTGGMKSVGADHDELTSTKATQRIGSRAYVSGDETDNTVLTDGTNTLYVLETPVVTDISPEINLSYIVSDFGTEEILTTDNAMTAPCNMDVVYGLNAADTIRRLPENYVATTEQTLTATQKAQILANLGISDMAHIVSAPASASATGTAGNIAYDGNYLYICTAANTWKRVAIATW